MAAVHSGGSILYSPLSVVTLTIITQLININHSSGAMINQEQMNIPSWPGFGLITFNSTIRCYIWSGSPADISQSPRDGDNAEMMRILLISSLLSSSGPGEETRALQFSH